MLARKSSQVKIGRNAFERLPVYLEIRTPKPYLVATVPHCGPHLARAARSAPIPCPILCVSALRPVTSEPQTTGHRGLLACTGSMGQSMGESTPVTRLDCDSRRRAAEQPWKPACYMETRPALKGITWAGAPDESDTPTTTLERDGGRPPRRSGETGGAHHDARERQGAPPRVGYGLGIRVGCIPIQVDPRRYMPSRLGIGPTHPGQASAPRAAPT